MIPLDTSQLTIIIYTLGALLIACIVMILWLSSRISIFMRGKHARSLEEIIVALSKDVSSLQHFQSDTSLFLKDLREHVSRTITYVESSNFKAFSGMDSGGNNSFVTALLNEHGTGVLISGLHTRDKIHVYSKPITGWASDRLLTDEENDLLTKIKKSRKM